MVIDLLKTTEDHENVEVAGGRPRVVPSVWLAYERQNNRWQNQHVRGHMFDTQINQWKEVEKRNVYNVAKCDKQHTYLAHLRHVHPIPYLYWKWTLHLVFTAYKSKFNLSFVLILYLSCILCIYIHTKYMWYIEIDCSLYMNWEMGYVPVVYFRYRRRKC